MMNQQAKQLLSLIASHNVAATDEPVQSSCRSMAISSGSGGVGRSLFALQTALSLGSHGQRVALLDANAGISHTAMLAGIQEWKSLDQLGPGTAPQDVAVRLNDRVTLLSGVSDWIGDGLTDAAAGQLDHWLDDSDWCVIDAGPRSTAGVGSLLMQADVPVLVTTPEPVPLAETYAALRALQAAGRSDVAVVLNRVPSDEAGRRIARQLNETATKFLRRRTAVAATLLDESPVAAAARSRQAGRFLSETAYGRTIASWTARLRAAA